MIYRNKKLLDLAKECPHCMSCRRPNDGSIVAAHSNSLEDGKGTGIKASDAAIAYLCFECHKLVDEGQMSKEEKRSLWLNAHIKTMRWLLESRKIDING